MENNELFILVKQAIYDVIDEKFLSMDEARKCFKPEVSRPTFNNWAKAGLFPEYRVGGRRYFRRSEILSSIPNIKRYKRLDVKS